MSSISTTLWHRLVEAVVGRIEPAQLAWGAAFGVLLGVVPHVNLLAIGLIGLVLCLRLNHGMALAVAVGTALFAAQLDPLTDPLGRWALTQPSLAGPIADLWQLPFVPWTDLNNTVVIGSFLLGVAALLPTFLLTYPLFHLFTASEPPVPQPQDPVSSHENASLPTATTGQGSMKASTLQTVIFEPVMEDGASKRRFLEPQAIDAALGGLGASGLGQSAPAQPATTPASSAEATNPLGTASTAATDATPPQVIETRIDVIRLSKRKGESLRKQVEAADISKPDQPMSEALQYLLRQARDNQDRRAA